MAEEKMDFLNAPDEKLRTWDKIWKLMIVAAAGSIVILALLGAIFV